MRRFYLSLLFILLLGTCTLGSSREDEDEQPDSDDEEEEEDPNGDDEDPENKQTGKKMKKEKEKPKEDPKKNNKKKHCDSGEERSVGKEPPDTSKMSTSTRTPSSTSTGTPTRTPSSTSTGAPTRTPSSTSTGAPTRTPSSTSTGNPTRTPSSSPTGIPGGIDMVAIFVPLSIFLLLLVLLVAVFLWRYSERFQCLRRFRWKDGNTVKIKPGSDVITIYATASHPLDSGHPGQRPLSGHVYQEISDVHVGASGPGSSYSTLGFQFQDQKAAAQQPADGQYSLVGLPAK
ncbi:uncharacterized protein LOC122937756 isoform X2 [Bufo gargarizans]|uniref:uncharacterized protein LOC122937756 isoform X2 n=1 Tax=Bufo gargarizans TaxID=30331 RepID=UPI001CF20075|nr:uncharacterized protein LOC122937756 isoform X2 [Bufo gargarizans]